LNRAEILRDSQRERSLRGRFDFFRRLGEAACLRAFAGVFVLRAELDQAVRAGDRSGGWRAMYAQ
jgi:hypothetical protein